MSSRPVEAPRDQTESAFTPILRRLWDAVPALLAAIFVDAEGECIDYVSSLAPYETKVCGAHMFVMMDLLQLSGDKIRFGEPLVLEVSSDTHELWVQRMGADYVVVLVLMPGFERVQLRNALTMAGDEFRREVGIDSPTWEGSGKRLSVRVRPSPGWQYAPQGYTEAGVRVVISDVLGRWTEEGGVTGDQVVCFRVRTAEGQELTLIHDPDIDGWIVRDS